MPTRRRVHLLALVCLASLLAFAPLAAAQESKSEAPAKELAQLLGGEVKYIGARLPDSQDQFVAALYIPGIQLLVISAKYQHPVLLNEHLAKHNYQDIYTDLHSSSYSIAGSKVFVEDLRADGLHMKRDNDAPPDSIERAGKRVTFDGDLKKQNLSDQQYSDAFTKADGDYAQYLAALMTEARKKGS